MDEINEINLEIHETKDIHDAHVNGSLTVIWRDWDQIISKHPKMIYVSSVKPQEVKGPHVHLKRHSYFTCIHGEVVFVIKKNNDEYVEITCNSEHPSLIHVPPNIATAHVNISNHISKILVLTDVAWKPNDGEMKNILFDDYDWEKWKKK
jgi:dTDP-4-dehydrorhamnose 3,5-epimerase